MCFLTSQLVVDSHFLFNRSVAFDTVDCFVLLEIFLHLASRNLYSPGVLFPPTSYPISASLLVVPGFSGFPVSVWCRARSLEFSLAVLLSLLTLGSLIASNTIYLLAAPRFTFATQMSFLNFRCPSSSVLDKLTWIDHMHCQFEIPKLNSYSSSKPAFLTVFPTSRNRTGSFLFLRLNSPESSFSFFHSHLKFM